MVGITGKIASGKSSATKYLASLGASILSSDEIVEELYKDEKVSNLLEKSLNIKFSTNVVNKNELRNHLLINPKDKKKVERLIHPLVEKRITEFLSKEINPIRVVEIPLLFEAKLDHYFDTIIVIDVNKNTQLDRLNSRDKNKAMYLLEINKTNKVDENKNKATYIVDNNGSEALLKKQLRQIFSELQDLIK